jgi:hypothetical protein
MRYEAVFTQSGWVVRDTLTGNEEPAKSASDAYATAQAKEDKVVATAS